MTVRRWDGSAYQIARVQRWTGSAWTNASRIHRWDGSAWVLIYPDIKLTNTTKAILDEFETISPTVSNDTAGLGFLATGELEAFATSLAGAWFAITPNDEWMLPRNADASQWEIRATTAPAGVSSTNTAGTNIGVTTWSNLSAGRRFQISATRSTVGATTANSGDFTIEIRDAVSLAVVASCTARVQAVARVSL